MKAFQLVTGVTEYKDFAQFASETGLSGRDLLFTNRHIYEDFIQGRENGAQLLFRGDFGSGEPTDIMADAILDRIRGLKFERIVAVGGGSILDTAKLLAVAGPGDSIDALYEHADSLKKRRPLIAVPASCGTGSEVTNISIVNRTKIGTKAGLVGPALFPDEAALVPELVQSMPYKVFATSSIDAMIHAVESYLSPNACAISEVFSEKALSLILPCWKAAANAGGKDAWKRYSLEFLRAANFAGIAFGHAGTGAVHALSYPLGGVYHVPHGESNQVMFAPVMRRYAQKNPDGKLASLSEIIASLLGCEPDAGLNALYALMNRILVRKPMHEYGVREEELPVFARSVVETQQRLLRNNYVPLSEEELLGIYQSAY